MDDRQLLRQFAEHNSQEAFAALTARYLNLVYSVCRRELDNDELAEDVTQAVFLILARKAPSLRREVVLSGWLFQTARFAAKNARTREQRRKAYEQKAAEAMGEPHSDREDTVWAEIEPLLNQSLASLREADRECILLRFFQGLSFAEVGTTLGLSEEAARKRMTRALEKMRQFLTKNGVVVPSVALAALMTAHAAKAAPTTCQIGITYLTTGALTGSPIYQLSEGVLHAMKIAQMKIVAGIAATAVIGLTTYAVASGVFMMAHRATSLTAFPKPGHLLTQSPGKTLTASQIAACCREAYGALQSYQGTTTVISQSVTDSFPSVLELHNSANIQFVRPGKIHVEGTDTSSFPFPYPFAYVSDGTATVETYLGKDNWKKIRDTETAVAGVTGIAQNAGTTIPAVLLGINWGTPLALGKSLDAVVREDKVDNRPCYVLTGHLISPTMTETEYLWIDEQTFLLRRSVSDRSNVAYTIVIAGKPQTLPAGKSHHDEHFTDEHLNQAIPDSTFTLPAAQ